MTTPAAGWLLQRYIESAQPASNATVRTYTTSGDAILSGRKEGLGAAQHNVDRASLPYAGPVFSSLLQRDMG
ncbi:hypothetical protein IP65_19800 [Novosphingobium sp. AAP1]|nr:hypothetical protein IP65_19800 [Novosphingobium sp. AAP1]